MRIDVHTHAFPPEVCQNREVYMDGEPEFRLLYGHPKAKMVTVEDLVRTMDEHEIDVSVVFGFPWINEDRIKRHNDYILKCVERNPGRLIPLACVHPGERYAVREVQRCLEAGARGVGELAVYSECDRQRIFAHYAEIAREVKGFSGVMLIHANEPVGHKYPGKATQGLEFYYEIARIASDVRLILAHWGGGIFFYELLKKETKEILKNVFYDTAASPFLYDKSIYRVACDIVGGERVLFGSDYPLISPEKYIKEIQDCGISKDDAEKILGANAARIFGIEIPR